MVATLVSSEFFLIVMFPVLATTLSLKVIVKLLPTATSVALLVGLKLLTVGTVELEAALVVNDQVVLPLIPAKFPPELLLNAPDAIST